MGSSLLAAREAFQIGNTDEALRLTKAYLRCQSEDGRAWELLGLIQYARGRFTIAVSALERASLFVPMCPTARVCLGHAYGRVGRMELSRDLLLELVSDPSLSVPLLLQVAVGLDTLDRPDLAMHSCRVALQRDPDHAQAFYDLGYYSGRCGFPPQVTESLARAAIKRDPNETSYRVGLASLLLKLRRAEEACQLVRDFSNEQIERISCRDCLSRLVGLFEAVQDYRRVVLCRQRALQLEGCENSSNCI